jgi:hypothetical protein
MNEQDQASPTGRPVCGVATIEPPAAFVAVRHRFNRPPDVAAIQLVSDTSRVGVRNVTAEGFEIAVGEVPRSCLSVLWRFDPAPRAPVSSAPEELDDAPWGRDSCFDLDGAHEPT